MSDERKPAAAQDDGVNAIGPAGQSEDPTVGRVVSGQPAGGPHTLGLEASERRERIDEGEEPGEATP